MLKSLKNLGETKGEEWLNVLLIYNNYFKTMGLIFSLFNVALGPGVPMAVLLYVRYILHGFTGALLCVPHSSLLTAKCVNFV